MSAKASDKNLAVAIPPINYDRGRPWDTSLFDFVFMLLLPGDVGDDNVVSWANIISLFLMPEQCAQLDQRHFPSSPFDCLARLITDNLGCINVTGFQNVTGVDCITIIRCTNNQRRYQRKRCW